MTYHVRPTRRTWERWDHAVPPIDTATGASPAVRNLIVLTDQWHDTHDVEDSNGKPSIYDELGGAGPFPAFIEGRHFGGTWSRPLADQPMTYTCADGPPLPLATGLTWIEVVGPGTTVAAGR